MEAFVALLRGINVGGHKKVPMADLKDALSKSGFKNPRTLLASGNAIFESDLGSREAVKDKVSEVLSRTFPFEIPVSVHYLNSIVSAVETDPFKKIAVRPETRLYVTFLQQAYSGDPVLPYEGEDGSFAITHAHEEMVFSYLELDKIKTVDAMVVLDRMFGKDITTRNWNTVLKITKLP